MTTNEMLLTQEQLDTARERLKNFLEDGAGTVAWLAKEAHVDKKRLYSWLSYQRQTMKPLQVEKLAKAAGMSLDEIIKPLGPDDYQKWA